MLVYCDVLICPVTQILYVMLSRSSYLGMLPAVCAKRDLDNNFFFLQACTPCFQKSERYLHSYSFTSLIIEQKGCTRTSRCFVPYLANSTSGQSCIRMGITRFMPVMPRFVPSSSLFVLNFRKRN